MLIKTLLLVPAAVLLAGAGPAPDGSIGGAATPDSCIELNRGDWNACNVGNSGAGNLPYKPVVRPPRTPNECIALNRGDWNACNVGNSGAGNLPYRAPAR